MSFIRSRNIERVFLFAIGAVMLFLFAHLFDMLKKKYFDEVPKRLAEGSMINLNAPKPAENLAALLQRGFYFEDPRDIELIRAVASQGFSGTQEMDNIGELNKRAFEISTDDAYLKGGESFRRRAKLSRTLIGFTGNDSLRFERERTAPPKLPSSVNIGLGNYNISGKIKEGENFSAGVLVRLQMILPQDSLYSEDVDDEGRTVVDSSATLVKTFRVDSNNHRQLVSLQAYARTENNGSFLFNGLSSNKAYELIPLKPGYQFGSSKGVQDLSENVAFTFTQVPHKMKAFSTRDFNNLRREKALIVRMPEEVTKWYWTIAVVFFAGFFLLHLFLSFRFPQADQLLLPLLMLLTGISFLTLLSLQDPLRDRFFGRSTLFYFAGGLLGIFVLLFFNLKKFTTDSGLYRLFVFKKASKAANGWPWAIAAMGLLMLTILLGTGPEGSGVKVNLFGFQPSEIVKFLIVVFLAGFFATNEKFISEYGRWQKRWRFFGFALIAILGVLGLFLWLGDLGPAMVACFTFIILFSFSRGDFAYAVGTAAVYVLSIWLTHNNILLATTITVGLLLLAIFFVKKQLTESAIMLLVVMASFLLLDQVPYIGKIFPGPVQRLVDRKAIWQDPWNNEVFGGDQIANGLWAMSSGGVQGQGIGEGFAKTIPEAHTDMILPSMGEEFGWAGIICVFIAFVLYLHRAVLIGRQTGTPFLFYLCSGIGIATFVQFLLIAGGSVGALPLSGVSLPFMSYGGSSLIANMLAAGFLLSASVVQGSAVQMKYISRQQDRNIMPALIAAFVGVILLGVNVGQYLFNNKKWVVQPALVADRSGARMFSYNPRIAILMNRIGAGNLLDRKGRVLATGNPDAFLHQQDSLIAAGLNPTALQALSHKRLDRYYPFYESMFFWVGDMNTGAFMGSTNGYYAEYEHMAELRGFPAPETKFVVTASRFRENRFLPQTAVEMTVAKRDFSALAPLLLAGINSTEVEKFKQRNRDVQMTVDAALQTQLQASLQSLDTLKNSRISVVVMEDNTGDVLASAMYPAAPVNEPERMSLSNAELARLPYFLTTRDLGFTYATQPGSTAKLITASAAFNKLGTAAAEKKTIQVRSGDLIRVKSEEPDEVGTITIERGIVKSNNPFFIRLANELRLEEDMGDIYLKAGLFLRGVGGYFYDGDLTDNSQWEKWKAIWRKTEFNSVRSYNPNDIRRTRGRGVSGMAWGQGELIATPASIARVASAIGNNGTLMHSRYVTKISDSTLPLEQGIPLLKDPAAAALMTKYMREQSASKKDKLGLVAAGKTGTPERILKGERINDGWYVFFAPKQAGEGHIVTCVRIEKTKGSSVAVKLAGTNVVPVLKKFGYIKSFDEKINP
ncbi:FtsW/RodA/SpoVE family cell cycle protein [Flavisolibacter ginsenosidimutans]|uniref:Cell cycle protein n=1 Tax=Flavisolibacter ginsenosidimutans TaxID=661481 RepID=A0A5B8UIC7_9BACT|nr:FtsW/RodA/SpoVE family cell cycle protein [Flavisolibacter ginsenosidimutans]QEC55929.1 cell cycle protein [Flavisolibacter ginsenosidimutans]